MKRNAFQAIADLTRKTILALISSQAMTFNAVSKHFNSSRQAISKHIKVLIEGQLVNQKGRAEGVITTIIPKN